MAALENERQEELDTLSAIYPELGIDPTNPFSARLELPIAPTSPLPIRFAPPLSDCTSYAGAVMDGAAYVEQDVLLSYLPPLKLVATLPPDYPADAPPEIQLSTHLDWLPPEKILELEAQAASLWEEYGRCQVLFVYIDYLQQMAERSFDLDQTAEGCLVLPSMRESELVAFDEKTKDETFNAGTYDCGVCLEPKKGSACYQMKRCGHVFCRGCLHDFYTSAIKEGDVTGVKCMDPGCGTAKRGANGQGRRRKKERTVHPRELLAMGIEESMVRRYVDMKRKKKIEADKTTVYCPRTWCQGPAKSTRYPPIPLDLTTYVDNEVSEDEADAIEQYKDALETKNNPDNLPPDSSDRLAVCEKCSLAFCKVCYMGWHGPFARCYPRNPDDLSAEEKASYDYIRMHTSTCPYCEAPTQKTMGCNHMNCFNCQTHFCYLCGSWLDASNPYQHFNKPGLECYQRLWELEEGDEGQAPADGRGFAGGARGYEQMAIEVARQADEAEAAAAQAEELAQENQEPPADPDPVLVAMNRIHLHDNLPLPQAAAAPRANQQRGPRRPRNPFPANPAAQGVARAVRDHERARGVGRRRPLAPIAGGDRAELFDRDQARLQRLLEIDDFAEA